MRILLEATEAVTNAAAEAERESEPPKMSGSSDVRQVNFVGSVDRNMDRMKVGGEVPFPGFESAGRRYNRNRAPKTGQLFTFIKGIGGPGSR